MTPERFRDLTDIYGADLRRWPEAEREAARACRRDHSADAEAALAWASALDRRLDRHRVAPPGAALHARIVASAPGAARSQRRMRIWRQGAGFAGLGLAGALAGALMIGVLVPITTQNDGDDGVYTMTAFDELPHELDGR